MKQLKIYLLTLGLGISFLNATSCVGFTDVSDSDAICDDLAFAKESLWVKGYSDGTFQPNKEINRAEFIKVIVLSILPMSLEERECFPDIVTGEYEIKKDVWYAPYVCAALEDAKIIKGNGTDKLFHPSNKIIYVEALKIVLKALGFKGDETLGHDWYTTYTNEASAMYLPIYDVTHIMTRGESINLIRETYKKYIERALKEREKWNQKKDCDAKNYHFYKLNREATCEEKWALQIYYEIGKRSLFLGSSIERGALKDTQNAKDIVDSAINLASAGAKIYGTAKNGATLYELKQDALNTSLKNSPGAEKEDAMEKTLNSVFDCAVDTLKKGTPMNKECGKVGLESLNNFLGAHKIYGITKNLNNYNIAMAYLDDFYLYGRDNKLVAINVAKVNSNSDMKKTIEGYAINSGYRNSWQWYDEYDVKRIVQLVEQIKVNVAKGVETAYLKKEALAQEQRNELNNFNIYRPISGFTTLNYRSK